MNGRNNPKRDGQDDYGPDQTIGSILGSRGPLRLHLVAPFSGGNLRIIATATSFGSDLVVRPNSLLAVGIIHFAVVVKVILREVTTTNIALFSHVFRFTIFSDATRIDRNWHSRKCGLSSSAVIVRGFS